MLDERHLLLFSHLLFHRKNYTGAHLSAAAIHLVLQDWAKHMVSFYHIQVSNTQFDWRDSQMMTGRGCFT